MGTNNLKIICPDCGATIERKLGLPALLYECICGKDWIMCLGRLVSRQEFHETADNFNGG